jgi:hypothetical protein
VLAACTDYLPTDRPTYLAPHVPTLDSARLS